MKTCKYRRCTNQFEYKVQGGNVKMYCSSRCNHLERCMRWQEKTNYKEKRRNIG